MPSVSLHKVTKSFGAAKVLDGISLTLAEGELLILLGPSGCGKSTLLRLIAGLETLDRGEIRIGERRIDKLRPKDRDVAMVFQNYALYPHMSVERNIAFPLSVAGVPVGEIAQRVQEAARMLGLEEFLKSKPGQLSGGQRQRVALGRAIVRKPSLFLLDEPLSNLDADLRARMRREIVHLQKELATTTIHVTHDQTEALTMADRIAVLNEGRLIQTGTPEELYGDSDALFAAVFIGQPKINLVEIRDGEHFRSYFGSKVLADAPFEGDRRLVVGLRPEAMRMLPSGGYRGRVTACEYLGDQYVVTLAFSDILLTASGMAEPVKEGEWLCFDFNASDLLFFDKYTGQRIRTTAG